MHVTVVLEADWTYDDPAVAAGSLREIARRIELGDTYGVTRPDDGSAVAFGRFYTYPRSDNRAVSGGAGAPAARSVET